MENNMLKDSTNSIRELLTAHGFKFSKSMGQNFLIDANIPKKIVKMSGIDKSCGVLEVGPGLGALTLELCMVAGKVMAVELDTRLISILESKFAENKNVHITQGDILKIEDARGQIERGERIKITTPSGAVYATLALSDRLKKIVLAGGLLNSIKQ